VSEGVVVTLFIAVLVVAAFWQAALVALVVWAVVYGIARAL
jgi:hypothetical protein